MSAPYREDGYLTSAHGMRSPHSSLTGLQCRVGAGAGRSSAPGGWRGGCHTLHKHCVRSFNADGTLVAQTVSSVTTRSTQDLAAPLSQILSNGTQRYVYGNPAERLFAQVGTSPRAWYSVDALGSVRATLSDAGIPQAAASYDAWGVPETPLIGSFGFTGELQQGSDVWLRARWYGAGRGSFGSRDPYAGDAQTPYSMMPYQYAYAAPTVWTDPRGLYSPKGLTQFLVPAYPTERIDMGYALGVSGTTSATVFAGNIGFEVVVDFYHFEIGEFWFTGKGGGLFGCSQIPAGLDDPLGPLDLPATASVGMYAAIFTGWKFYPESDGIKAYEGDFRVVSGSSALPISFPAAVTVQGFASRDGKMVGGAFGVGVTSDRLPIGLSYAENHYYPAIAIQKFHGMDHSGKPLPPTGQETSAFINTLQHASQVVSALSGGVPMNILDMIQIILYNADVWNERERLLRAPFA